MPVELQIIRAREFIRMATEGHAQGQFDLTASCAVLAKLATACKRRGIHRALLDVQKARVPLTPTEMASLVNVFREIGFPDDLRLAILHSGDPFRRARMFALISRMKGWSVRAFGKFEEAMVWLSKNEDKSEIHTLGKQISVNHSDGHHHTKPLSIKAHPARKVASYANVSSNVERTASRTS